MSPGRDRASAFGTEAPNTILREVDQCHRSPAENEVGVRVHAVAIVAQAMSDGCWEPDVASLDALGGLCSAAGRWALVAELEAV